MCDCTAEMYFPAKEWVNYRCAVANRSQTLQYRSEGFGAGLEMYCDSGNTMCRVTAVVSM